RLARAQRSIESFANGAGLEVAHLTLTGNGERYAYDPKSALLTAPSADSYECLPQKVFHGLAILTLALDPRCVLKVDDDHRLRDAHALRRLIAFASATHEPVQLGEINRTPLPSAHHRAW